jgi:hypothetical protein
MALFVNFVAIFPKEQWMVAAKGCSLSAGRAVSLLVALLLLKSHLSCFSRWSLTPSEDQPFHKDLCSKKQESFRKEPN